MNEICKQISWHSKRIQVFHLRFSDNQAEIDLILERGQLVAIEIKASSTIGKEDFRHIAKFKEIAGKKFMRGIVLYTGNEKVLFDFLWQGALI